MSLLRRGAASTLFQRPEAGTYSSLEDCLHDLACVHLGTKFGSVRVSHRGMIPATATDPGTWPLVRCW